MDYIKRQSLMAVMNDPNIRLPECVRDFLNENLAEVSYSSNEWNYRNTLKEIDRLLDVIDWIAKDAPIHDLIRSVLKHGDPIGDKMADIIENEYSMSNKPNVEIEKVLSTYYASRS